MNRPPVKQFCRSELTEGQIHFALWTDCDRARLSHFLALYAEARGDFAGITPADVQVATDLNGNPERVGIEFTLRGVEPPEGYQEISLLEFAR